MEYVINQIVFIYFQAEDIIKLHKSKCPNFNKDVQVSTDGVSECKSNVNSLDVYSTRFSQCRTIYPLQIIRPIGKYRVDNQQYLDDFLSDVCANDLKIKDFIGDNPKRSEVRLCKSHSAYYPCEYCESKGSVLSVLDRELSIRKKKLHEQKNKIIQQITEAEANNNVREIDTLKSVLTGVNEAIKNINRKNNNIVWPASTKNGPKRTVQKVLEILDKIENGDILSMDESKGIMGRSLLLDIPYFHFINDITVEYLHGVCLGVVRKTIVLTFNVGEIRQRNTTRKLSSVNDFNQLMSQVKVVREYSRRSRNLDLSVMKGQEYRNIIIVFFPLIINCIEPNAKERRLWLLLAYSIRACVLPDVEFNNIDISVIDYCGKHFYNLFESLFHSRNCSYYVHVVGSHMPQIRSKGPLTATSAFGFESFYGEMRHSFTPRTNSPLKQIMENILLKRSISHHCCQSTIYFSPNDSPMESNSLIYTFFENEYQFHKIKSIDDNVMECYKLGKYPTSFPETPTLNWGKIGVFQAGGISEETTLIMKENVAGKVLQVNDLFLTCPNNVLLEK